MTDQPSVENAYRSGDFTDLAFHFVPVGIVVTENRVIRDCNQTFAGMFGYTRAALRDQTFAILYPSQEEFANIRNRGVDCLREGGIYWDERVMMRQGGDLFWCRVRGHTFTPADPLMRAVWSFADLSEIRGTCIPSQIAKHFGNFQPLDLSRWSFGKFGQNMDHIGAFEPAQPRMAKLNHFENDRDFPR